MWETRVKFKSSEIVKLLCCQVLNVPYQSLYGTQEFYRNRPLQALINRKDVTFEQLDMCNIVSNNIFGFDFYFMRVNSGLSKKKAIAIVL